jgi:aspartyl-tRNA synthetase
MIQIVFSPGVSGDSFQKAESVRNEYVLAVSGRVDKRPEGTINLNMSTGQIEVYADKLRILNAAKTPPFYIEDDLEVDETLRLKYGIWTCVVRNAKCLDH